MVSTDSLCGANALDDKLEGMVAGPESTMQPPDATQVAMPQATLMDVSKQAPDTEQHRIPTQPQDSTATPVKQAPGAGPSASPGTLLAAQLENQLQMSSLAKVPEPKPQPVISQPVIVQDVMAQPAVVENSCAPLRKPSVQTDHDSLLQALRDKCAVKQQTPTPTSLSPIPSPTYGYGSYRRDSSSKTKKPGSSKAQDAVAKSLSFDDVPIVATITPHKSHESSTVGYRSHHRGSTSDAGM
jgi:hypothetical protein